MFCNSMKEEAPPCAILVKLHLLLDESFSENHHRFDGKQKNSVYEHILAALLNCLLQVGHMHLTV